MSNQSQKTIVPITTQIATYRHASIFPLLPRPTTSSHRLKSKSVHFTISKFANAVTINVEPSHIRVMGGRDRNHCSGPPPPTPPAPNILSIVFNTLMVHGACRRGAEFYPIIYFWCSFNIVLGNRGSKLILRRICIGIYIRGLSTKTQYFS